MGFLVYSINQDVITDAELAFDVGQNFLYHMLENFRSTGNTEIETFEPAQSQMRAEGCYVPGFRSQFQLIVSLVQVQLAEVFCTISN